MFEYIRFQTAIKTVLAHIGFKDVPGPSSNKYVLKINEEIDITFIVDMEDEVMTMLAWVADFPDIQNEVLVMHLLRRNMLHQRLPIISIGPLNEKIMLKCAVDLSRDGDYFVNSAFDRMVHITREEKKKIRSLMAQEIKNELHFSHRNDIQ
ncbi:hypothetical protein ACVBEF_14865 [Glaciimonas sp. GG7]